MKPSQYIDTNASKNAFRIVANGKVAAIYVDPNDEKGVARAAKDLANDVGMVSGIAAQVNTSVNAPKGSILIGTIGSSQIIDKLIADKKIDVSEIKGQWESYMIQTVDGNLVVAGSDRRGTIYGIYDISENIGVSPWYWWADVPVKKSDALFVKAGRYVQEAPKVKYRGIFINDEEPSFGGWARDKFGGINSKMYAHMFELLLRLKANYLWPAMWGKSFNEDDPLNPVVANEFGIVMGTSHHEPMMRSHTEYTSRKDEVGAWNYATNKTNLDKFFTDGLERNKAYDNLITIGMRGDGDVALSEEGDEKNMETLRQVVKGQREIIQKVYNKNPSEVPQMWAIFTEVQRYYDAGLTVPDDVLLLFCDNNWGYIRRAGPEKDKDRKGGMGLYYHIDMNGGPWNDRWINTTTIPKLYQQFNLAYRSGLDDLWVVNVGDLKPKELAIDFIMRFASNPDAYHPDNLKDYTTNWAARIFGAEHAAEIADIVSKYPKYNLWRKPEVQGTQIFSFVNHHEADRVTELWRDLTKQVETLRPKIAPEAQDAFYQLVYYPAKASA
ncbi:MAG: glycosyl hydrolase 115 family protein, partial [Prolixibacteraceae bacterium]|nr:glycosyl hydrolase 115 family protein [Prolixibacteraceae bacterium]